MSCLRCEESWKSGHPVCLQLVPMFGHQCLVLFCGEIFYGQFSADKFSAGRFSADKCNIVGLAVNTGSTIIIKYTINHPKYTIHKLKYKYVIPYAKHSILKYICPKYLLPVPAEDISPGQRKLQAPLPHHTNVQFQFQNQ